MTPRRGQKKNGPLLSAPVVVPGETGDLLAAQPGTAVAVMVPSDDQIFHQDDVRVDTRPRAGMTSVRAGPRSETWMNPMRPLFLGLASPLPLPTTRRSYPIGWLGGGADRRLYGSPSPAITRAKIKQSRHREPALAGVAIQGPLAQKLRLMSKLLWIASLGQKGPSRNDANRKRSGA